MPVETIIRKAAATEQTDQQTAASEEQILTESGFYWREAGGVKILVCRKLEEAGFTNGFSTRLGGVSPFPKNDLNLAGFDEDMAENIAENRRRFLNVFGGGFDLATVWQVHGDDVKMIDASSELENSRDKYDGMISVESGILLGVKTADCVPVLIGDRRTNAFAAVHAGWRGTVRSIAAKAVKMLANVYGSEASNLVAAIGPAAGCSNYEVGSDVISEFEDAFADSNRYFSPTREGHALIDLHLANRNQLISVGLDPSNIFTAPFCTMSRSDLFFSYRIEKRKYGKTGRLLSVIGRR